MDQLDYDYHYAEYAGLIGDHDAESRLSVERKAQQIHIYHVHDALRDEQIKSVVVSQRLKIPQAQYFARFGIGRRTGMLWSAFRSLLEIVTVGRDEPLSSDEVKKVDRDLNAIYVNIVGTIDNYAWCLLHELGSATLKATPANRVGLFARGFLQEASFASLRTLLTPYASWFTDLRSRRDPAAHRIPLSVPPAALRPGEAARYQEINQKISEAVILRKFDVADQLSSEQEKLGTFVPKFVHDPSEDLIPIYPTIPQDLAQLVRVSDAVRQFLG